VAVNKSELVQRIAESADLSRAQAENAVNAFIDTVIAETKKGEKTSITGFGNFVPTARSARMGRNPQTGAPVKIAASKGVRFAAGAAFKTALGGKSAAKSAGSKAAAKKAPAKKATAKKSSAKKAPAKKAATSAKKR
jgi:DNA-binding protein HU-beta